MPIPILRVTENLNAAAKPQRVSGLTSSSPAPGGNLRGDLRRSGASRQGEITFASATEAGFTLYLDPGYNYSGLAIESSSGAGTDASAEINSNAIVLSREDSTTVERVVEVLEADPTAAQGTLTIDTNPADGDTITLGLVTYQIVDAPAAPNDIQRAGALADTRSNLLAAINGTGTPGTEYFVGTAAPHPSVSASDFNASDESIITARTPGDDGNTIATTETFTAPTNVFDAATLGTTTYGLNGVPGTSVELDGTGDPSTDLFDDLLTNSGQPNTIGFAQQFSGSVQETLEQAIAQIPLNELRGASNATAVERLLVRVDNPGTIPSAVTGLGGQTDRISGGLPVIKPTERQYTIISPVVLTNAQIARIESVINRAGSNYTVTRL
jgi:hypothetical protein